MQTRTKMTLLRTPWHYALILIIVGMLVGMAHDALADEWTPLPASERRIITNMRTVANPCGKYRSAGCLTRTGNDAWEMQVRESMSAACQTHVALHEIKHMTHDHEHRDIIFMIDDGNGNMMECGP